MQLACKEAAGWQCEYVHPNGQRCKAREGQLRRKRGKHGRPDSWTVKHMHACHVDGDYDNSTPRLICYCPAHHMQFDRGTELQEHPNTMYRKGYQSTTTDTLLEEVNSAGGISIWEANDGFHLAHRRDQHRWTTNYRGRGSWHRYLSLTSPLPDTEHCIKVMRKPTFPQKKERKHDVF